MSTQTEIPDDEDLHETAIRHANEAWTAEADNFDQGRDDQRFFAGEQWLASAKQQRDAENRPCLSFPLVRSFVVQVTGDVRRDTPAIKISPAKGPASEAMAEVFNGTIRNIEVQSNAKAAYVQGVENACVTGMGCIKAVTEYSTDDRSEQDIRIKRITDPFAVVWDPAAREPDKSDARYLHEYFDLPKEEFKRQFPDAIADSVPTGPNGSSGLSWWTNDTVRVAQYWFRKPVKKTILQLADGRSISAEQALKETKEGESIEVISKREVNTFEVKMALISGHQVLSKGGKAEDWAGQYLPYAPVIGEEIFVDGRIIRKGMIRDMKDAQRVYNYMRTVAVEAAALQPKAPYIGTVKQFGVGTELEKQWAQAGSKNLPFLAYEPDGAAPGPPQRSPPAMAQDGLDRQALLSHDELKAITGIYDASLGAKSNETSGRAILARQREGDTGTFHYIDNLGTAIRRIGLILIDLIPKIYDTPRVVRVLREDGSQEMVGVNVPQHDPMSEVVKRMNDLSAGEYDVVVNTGPSFATRRQEAMEGMQELVRAAPQLLQVAGDLLIKNMDFPGAEEVAKRLAPADGPPKPNPAEIAAAMKTAAEADLTTEKATGQKIENILTGVQAMQLLQSMHTTMQAIQQQIAGGQQADSQTPPQGPQMPMAQGSGGDAQPPPGMPEQPPQMAELTPMNPPRTIQTPRGPATITEE